MPDLLTIKEAAEALRISRMTLWQWRKAGLIRVVKPVGRVLVPKTEIDRLLSASQEPVGEPVVRPVIRRPKKTVLYPVVT